MIYRCNIYSPSAFLPDPAKEMKIKKSSEVIMDSNGKIGKEQKFFYFFKIEDWVIYMSEEPLAFPQPLDAYIRHCNAHATGILTIFYFWKCGKLSFLRIKQGGSERRGESD